mmetsp:Transcript_11446/g.24411  ORF Transcript_11446/g.24411 Transcript_11446/m.24411 type:complete len:84 (+) Transcript_11446:417-668(+)
MDCENWESVYEGCGGVSWFRWMVATLFICLKPRILDVRVGGLDGTYLLSEYGLALFLFGEWWIVIISTNQHHWRIAEKLCRQL